MMSGKNWIMRLCFAKDGRIRLVWRLAGSAAVCLAALYGVVYLLGMGFGKLFDAWGLTTENLVYAPQWARIIVAYHADFTYALAYGACIGASLVLCGREKIGKTAWWKGLLSGIGMGAGLTALALAVDSMRLEWPLGEPVFGVMQVSSLAVLVLGGICSEVLTKRVFFKPIRESGRSWTAYCISVAASMLLGGAWFDAVGIVNGLLLGVLSCALYERAGIRLSAAFRIGWTAWCSLIFRFPQMEVSAQPFYSLYHVSDAWLTGGVFGPECGLWMTMFCLAALAALFRNELRTVYSKVKKTRRRSNG